MRKHVTYAGLVVLGALAVAAGSSVLAQSGSSGGTKSFRANLNGYQEDASVSTTGKGLFTAKLDEDNQMIDYELSYAALEGGATLFAHIHFGGRDHNGGVSAFLCGGGDKPPCPAIEGTVTGVIDPADVVGPNGQGIEPGSFAELVAAMRVGNTYANVHTTRWPGGEIRGQINNDNQREFAR